TTRGAAPTSTPSPERTTPAPSTSGRWARTARSAAKGWTRTSATGAPTPAADGRRAPDRFAARTRVHADRAAGGGRDLRPAGGGRAAEPRPAQRAAPGRGGEPAGGVARVRAPARRDDRPPAPRVHRPRPLGVSGGGVRPAGRRWRGRGRARHRAARRPGSGGALGAPRRRGRLPAAGRYARRRHGARPRGAVRRCRDAGRDRRVTPGADRRRASR